MSHLLICGAAGYTNAGDDAILWGMLAQLQTALPGRSIRVAGGPELSELLGASTATPVSYDDRAELARAIDEADLVILGGGGLLYDIGYEADLSRFLGDPSDRQWLYETARIAAAAAAAGRPTMLFSLGAGPLLTDAARRVAKFICDHSKAITLRDQASADLLAECGLPRSRLHVAADPALMVEAADGRDFVQRSHLAGAPRPWVALNLRPWGDAAQHQRLVAEARAFVRAVRERLGGTTILLPFQRMYDDDRPLLLRVAQAQEGAVLVESAPPPPDLVSALSRCDLVVGMRLHALILALDAGKPFVALSYDPKVDEFARSAGLESYAQSVADFDSRSLIESCQALLQRADIPAHLQTRLTQLRASAALSAELAKDLLESKRPRSRPAAASAPTDRIRVLMRIRPDHLEQPGGDTVQMNETKRRLEHLGVAVDISGEESPDLSGCDLVHAFNLGRPEEPHRHCLEAAEQGKPVALSTVYWDFSEFWTWGDPDYWELPTPEEGLPHPRPAPPPDPVEARRRARLDQQRRAAIECAAVYLPNGQGEADLLHDTYGMDPSRTVVVTNAVDDMFFEAKPDLFVEKYGLRDFVLCAARVEKRKNQLALVAALRGASVPLVIAGQPNPTEYLDLCRRYADENVTFLGPLSKEELASAYAAAKVHALPGWFETPGLSTLEAAAAGCAIVSTDRGTAREYFGDMVRYCDPKRIDSIREAVLAAYREAPPKELKEHIRARCTWERAAESTLEGYRLALAISSKETAADRHEAALQALRGQADYLAKLAADRAYEAQQMKEWGETVEAELKRLQAEFDRLASRRLYRWSSAAARAGWSLLRVLGVKP